MSLCLCVYVIYHTKHIYVCLRMEVKVLLYTLPQCRTNIVGRKTFVQRKYFRTKETRTYYLLYTGRVTF